MNKGLSEADARRELEKKGYKPEQIADAINQANIKVGVEAPSEIPAPPQAKDFSPEAAEAEEPAPEYEGEYGGYEAPTEYGAPEAAPEGYEEAPAAYPQEAPGVSAEDVQQLVEEVIEEKWKAFIESIGDVQMWKAKIMDEVESVKQEVLRTEQRLDNLQSAVLGQVKGYGQSITDMGAEIKAMEKVMEKILEPMTENIKELSRLTAKMKEGKK